MLSHPAADMPPDSLPELAEAARGPDEARAMAALGSLGSLQLQAAADLLARLAAELPQKNRAKAARRSLYRLGQLGIHTQESGVSTASAAARADDPTVHALVSPEDAGGDQAVWVVRRGSLGDLRFADFVVGELSGIKEANGLDPISKRGFDWHREAARQRGLALLAMDLPFCRRLIDDASRRNEATARPLPDEYSRWRRLIEGPSSEFIWPQDLSAERLLADPSLLSSSNDLLDHAEATLFMPPLRALQTYGRELLEVERRTRTQTDEPLSLAKVQAEGSIVRRAVRELLTVERLEVYRGRLENLAGFFWRQGRQHAARQAAAAALALADGNVTPLEEHPFLWGLVRIGVLLAAEEEAGDQADKRAEPAKPTGRVELPAAPPAPEPPSGYVHGPAGLLLPK